MEKTSRCQHIPKGERVSMQVYRDMVVCEKEAKWNCICDCTALPDKGMFSPEAFLRNVQYSRGSSQVVVIFSNIRETLALNNSSVLKYLIYNEKSHSSDRWLENDTVVCVKRTDEPPIEMCIAVLLTILPMQRNGLGGFLPAFSWSLVGAASSFRVCTTCGQLRTTVSNTKGWVFSHNQRTIYATASIHK